MDDLYEIITVVSEPECKRIARKVVRDLQGMTEGMQSGDDSVLANLWDEVCVQVQGEQSIFWDYYVGLMEGFIEQNASMLSEEILKAIWLQTENGISWRFDLEYDDEEDKPTYIEFSLEDIVTYIMQDHVLKLAADWNNRRIEKFMERGSDF